MRDSDPQVPSPDRRRAGPVSDLFPLSEWFRHHAIRSFPVMLFLTLICVPPIALVILDANLTMGTFTVAAWIFAAYFAVAWFLLLCVIVKPGYVTRPMLTVVVVVALVTQVPLALMLEGVLHSTDATLGLSIATVGIPEELVKAIPVLVVALLFRDHILMPRGYLFLGAVSGLAFGASEVVHYFTTNSVAEFYQTVQAAIPSINHLIVTGHSAPASVFSVLIGPVWYFIISFIWRFITDPISHACWAGVTGYFIGLAATRRQPWVVAWAGLAIAAVLHGLNDWSRVNGHPAWILTVIASGVIFLGYARVGARVDDQFTGALPTFTADRGRVSQAPAPERREPTLRPADLGQLTPAQREPSSTMPASRIERQWWQPLCRQLPECDPDRGSGSRPSTRVGLAPWRQCSDGARLRTMRSGSATSTTITTVRSLLRSMGWREPATNLRGPLLRLAVHTVSCFPTCAGTAPAPGGPPTCHGRRSSMTWPR
jgi:RsiW-degrading membrane proteinase PrsW (M82 family)